MGATKTPCTGTLRDQIAPPTPNSFTAKILFPALRIASPTHDGTIQQAEARPR